MKIVWLTGWYPTPQNPLSGIFIRRHFHALHDELGKEQVAKLIHLGEGNIDASEPFYSKQEFVYLQPPSGFRLIKSLTYHLKAWRVLSKKLKDADLVHVHAGDKLGFWAAYFKRRFSYKVVYTEHWAIFNSTVADAYSNRNPWFRYYMRRLWKSTDVVACISEQLYESMANTYGTRPPKTLFPNVLGKTFENYLESLDFSELGPNSSRLKILHVSNFERRKNVPELILSFLRLVKQGVDAELILIGVGSHEYKSYESDQICVFPSMTEIQLCEFYRGSDVLLLPSDAENTPCVISEALAFGMPVITTDTGGVSEMVNPSNGILIPRFKTPEEKENKILNALLDFHTKSQTFDRKAIHFAAMERYSSKPVMGSLIQTYQKLICVESPEYQQP